MHAVMAVAGKRCRFCREGDLHDNSAIASAVNVAAVSEDLLYTSDD